MTEKSSVQEPPGPPVTTMNNSAAVNANILSSMRESISALPPTPKFLRKKPLPAAAAEPDMTEVEEGTTESSDIEYPTRQLNRVPSIKRAASLFKKYPSLSLVRQMSSRSELLLADAVLQQQEQVVEKKIVEEHSEVEHSEVSIDESESSSTWDEMEIEVFQGVSKRLRGSAETFQAFRKGECIETACMVCSVELLCMSNCEGVICPLCLSMSPLETLSGDCSKNNGTVGLGIQYEKKA